MLTTLKLPKSLEFSCIARNSGKPPLYEKWNYVSNIIWIITIWIPIIHRKPKRSYKLPLQHQTFLKKLKLAIYINTTVTKLPEQLLNFCSSFIWDQLIKTNISKREGLIFFNCLKQGEKVRCGCRSVSIK